MEFYRVLTERERRLLEPFLVRLRAADEALANAKQDSQLLLAAIAHDPNDMFDMVTMAFYRPRTSTGEDCVTE